MLAAGLIWLQSRHAGEARQRELTHLVEAAIGVLDGHHKLAQSGTISEQEAKVRALAAIGTMRYGQGDYFFVQDRQMVMLMHPVIAELVGKPQLDLKDANGVGFNREIQRQVQEKGTAQVSYMWPKAGSPVPLFRVNGAVPQGVGVQSYAVSKDGTRFLISRTREVTAPITVVLNWKPRE